MSPRACCKCLVISLGLFFSCFLPVHAQQGGVKLDYEFFKNEVQPIFLAKRNNNVRCIQCHDRNPTFRLQPLDEGQFFWTEEQSRMNFDYASAFVAPGEPPLKSRLLTHPLATSAGGDPFHGGGKHFANQSDPKWRILAEWVAGANKRSAPSATVVRIIQTNAAGDDTSIINPATNTVVGTINDIEIPHGVTSAPDGKTLWSTSKVYSHVYIHSLPDLKEIGQVFVGQHPEWITFTPYGKQVYIGAAGDNATFVVDATTMTAIAKIDVGQVPKRVGTVYMQVD